VLLFHQETNLGDKNEEQNSAIGIDQALVLLPCSTASKQSNGKDDTSKYDDEDRGVDIVVTEKVEVILGVNLGIGSEAN